MALACTAAGAETPRRGNLVDNPRYHTRDPQETVITDIAGWSHPTKAVFSRYHLRLTKIELMWNKVFPVFHVVDFGADPAAGPADPFFAALEVDLLRANANNAFKIVEDNAHDGFVVAYDRRKRLVDLQMVQGESP